MLHMSSAKNSLSSKHRAKKLSIEFYHRYTTESIEWSMRRGSRMRLNDDAERAKHFLFDTESTKLQLRRKNLSTRIDCHQVILSTYIFIKWFMKLQTHLRAIFLCWIFKGLKSLMKNSNKDLLELLHPTKIFSRRRNIYSWIEMKPKWRFSIVGMRSCWCFLWSVGK